ncbi:MAG TPA: NADH-quinone oxidoreductase subunit L [Solirubrobacteraceae bacterium]|jgi:NADH-quinone oxidoreductase subunit L|nr:NADH-quinone oxidoreductase subunit L [Solirubrobacteraceae bacterium]
MSATTYGWLVLACPLVGSVGLGLGYRVWPGRAAGWIATLAIALSFLFSVLAFIKLLGAVPDHRQLTSTLWNYDVSAGVDAKLQILLDPLSVFMILVVSGVSTLIHLYSVSYMTLDRGYVRYFSYLNYFVFSMLLLVLAGNFVLLIVGWAFVGAASYLLISFWYRRTTATRAGIKAFVINVVGDVGLVIATFIVFQHVGSVQFLTVFHGVHQDFARNGAPIVIACLLLLVGAFAKSAQVPLHTWLPDAMEGPTPVSALIHAATMVTAGVYLIARMHVLFEWAPTAADVGAIGGCVTLLIAATIALVMTDIKRVIAYSTMSQIGYMIMGVCLGAYSAGLFHLMTHAFFKALLFMAAGSVIGAMAGNQSLDRMGGFRRALPFTFACFIIGGLALSGLPPFSGWLSKDDIIAFVDHRGGAFVILGIAAYAGALMTGVYTFRMIFRTFLGDPVPEAVELEHGHLHHAEVPTNPMTGEEEDTDVGFPGPGHFIAEREWPMKIAMSTLAVLAVVGGVLQIPGVDDAVTRFLAPTFADSKYSHTEVASAPAWVGLVIGALIAVAGISIAYRIWVARPGTSLRLRERFSNVYVFLSHKWYFDEIIDFLIVRPVLWTGRLVDTTGERGVIGGFTDATTGAVRATSAAVRRGQTGFLRYYAALMIVCLGGVALYFLISST